MMSRLGGWLLLLGLFSVLGCGGATGKNIYKDKDKPQPAEKDK